MGITGRSLAGAGLQGLGEGLQQWSAQTIKRKQIEDEWNFELKKQRLQQEAARETAMQGRQDKLLEGLMTRPGDTAALLDLAPLLLPNMKPEDLARLREAGLQHGTQQFTQRMNTLAKPEDAPADLRLAMSAATGHNYGTDAAVPPTVDAAQWGGEGAESGVPEVLQAINAQKARLAQLDAAKQAAIAEAGQKSESEARGKTTGELTVKHNMAPITTADAVDLINAEGPAKAAVAGQTRYAENMANVDPRFVTLNQQKITGDELAKLTPPIISGEARRAGAITGAQQAAEAPYKTPTMASDQEGNPVPLRWGPQGASVVPGMPENLRMGPQQKLTQGQVETKSIMNTAELQGVQILKELHDAGLDRDNTPWSPRYTNFIARNLKIAPEDFKRADVGQRAAFVQGTLLRGLAGARPSREWMEMLGAHLPDPVMSGQQLAKVLNNVLQQQGQKRDDMAFSTGRSRTWMGPQPSRPGEMTYDQWLEAIKQERAGGARAGTAPPGLQTAPAGPSTDRGQAVIDDILKNNPR